MKTQTADGKSVKKKNKESKKRYGSQRETKR
jgi:hypothetical protein